MRNGMKNVQNMDTYLGYEVDFWVFSKNLNSDLIHRTSNFLTAKKKKKNKTLGSKPCTELLYFIIYGKNYLSRNYDDPSNMNRKNANILFTIIIFKEMNYSI